MMNLLQIIGSDTRLKKTSGTHGGEWHGPCPFCGGKDRFWVQPKFGTNGRWRCRQCDKGGDAYRYLMEMRQIGFREAKAIVDGEPIEAGKQPKVDLERAPEPPPQDFDEPVYASSAPEWQRSIGDFVSQSFEHGRELDTFQAWLRSRGIDQEAAKEAHLGASPESFERNGINFYRGVVIPCYGDYDQLLYCKVRTGKGQYLHIKGSDGRAVYGLYQLPRDPLNGLAFSGNDVILVETELDALMLRSVLRNAVEGLPYLKRLASVCTTPLALGSTTGSRQHEATITSNSFRVFVALDADDPGQQAAQWWIEKGALLLPPVGAKDPGEMFEAGGAGAIMDWLSPALFG